jgi:hypothetical protein
MLINKTEIVFFMKLFPFGAVPLRRADFRLADLVQGI